MGQFRVSVLTFAIAVSSATLFVGCEEEELPDIYMIWKGVGDDQNVYESTLVSSYPNGNPFPETGPYWRQQYPFEHASSAHGPAVASFAPTVTLDDPRDQPSHLFSAWRGNEGDEQLYYHPGGSLEPQKLPVQSSHGPALAVQTPLLYVYMAWKGPGSDQGIYWATLSHPGVPFGGDWQWQGQVPKVGTSEKPALTYHYPLLYMAWKGIDGDSGIYISTNAGDMTWQPQRRVPDVGTSRGPAIVYFNGALRMVWKGAGEDQGIYYASSSDDGNTWTPQENIPGVGTSDSPAICATKTRMYIAWKGIEGDPGLYWSWSYTGSSWVEQLRVPGVGSSHGPAIAVADAQIPRR
jgi:hypothetical protein